MYNCVALKAYFSYSFFIQSFGATSIYFTPLLHKQLFRHYVRSNIMMYFCVCYLPVHFQDAAGRVVFGFNTPDQTRMEARALDGSVRGSYSYQDPTGKIVKVNLNISTSSDYLMTCAKLYCSGDKIEEEND